MLDGIGLDKETCWRDIDDDDGDDYVTVVVIILVAVVVIFVVDDVKRVAIIKPKKTDRPNDKRFCWFASLVSRAIDRFAVAYQFILFFL